MSSGALPPGLTLSAAGLISGSPTTSGTYTFTLQVADALGGSDTAALTIAIRTARPRKAYLTSMSNIAACVRFGMSCYSEILAVDLEARRLTNTIRLDNQMLRIPARASSDGRFVYLVASPFGSTSSRLLKIDTSTDTIVINRPLTVHPTVLALSPDDSTIYLGYASNGGSGIQKLNARSLAVMATYPNPAPDERHIAIAVSPDSATLIVLVTPQITLATIALQARIETVDASDGRVVRSVALGTLVRPLDGELTPNGNHFLVGTDGVPKLVDFGIAKLLSDAPAASMTRTQHFTLLYASPEQLRGDPVSTSTDIYSLGLLLYEMVTGALPHDGAGASPHAHARAVLEDDVRPPAWVRSNLRGHPEDGPAPGTRAPIRHGRCAGGGRPPLPARSSRQRTAGDAHLPPVSPSSHATTWPSRPRRSVWRR